MISASSHEEAVDQPPQSIEEIMQIIEEAAVVEAGAQSPNGQYLTGCLDIEEDMEEDLETDAELDLESSGEIVYAIM